MSGNTPVGTDMRVAALAILAFVVLGFWLVRGSSSDDKPYMPAYSTFTTDASGTKAAYELLRRRGRDVSRHMLTEHEYPDGSCVVICDESNISPFKAAYNSLDVRALQLHVADGGSVVIFCDTDMMLMSEIEGMLYELQPEGEEEEEVPPAALAIRGGGGEPATNGIWRGSMAGQRFELSDYGPPLLDGIRILELASSYYTPVDGLDPLLSVEEPYGRHNFERLVGVAGIGDGNLVVVNRPEIISNSWIDRADNHRLVVAIVEAAAAGRPILFDEHVHGFNEERMTAGSLLASTTGGHLLLLAILFIIFMYLGLAVSPARFISRKAPPRRQSAEMILGQASLFHRAAADRGTLRHIVDGVKHELLRTRHFGRLPDDGELLEWIQANMPRGWKAEEALMQFLQTGEMPPSRNSLIRASASCDAVRVHIRGGGGR